MEWIDLFIPVMMLALPVIVALIDRKRRKMQGIPPVLSRPISFEDEEADASPREEGVRVNVGKAGKEKAASGIGDGESQGPKLEIDRKKLILYSEILKPKFDE